MLLHEIVEKYAGSEWLKSYQYLEAGRLREESAVARKMQNVFWLNYGVQIKPAAFQGYYAFDSGTSTFRGLNLATKKEVAMFTLFLVRYCFPQPVTLELYLDFLEKFVLEYPEMVEEITKFKEELVVKLEIC